MLSSENIRSIIESGEGYNAEFKVRVPNKLKELSEEICAFANASGGVLILGVNDSNQIIGSVLDNAKKSAIQNALNEINPQLPTEFYKVELEGKELWVIEVNSGAQKPYVLSGAIYVRQGPNTQKLTSVEEMRDFFQQAERIYFDEAACNEFDIEKDIEPDWFEEFRLEAGLSKTIGIQQIVSNLKLIDNRGAMKNGGVLFFGKQPEKFIETAMIRCVAFDGLTKTQIFDDKFFGGPLVLQYRQAMQWLKGKLNIRYEIEGGGPRKEHWEIPETAFKEAIINALSHRDYYDKGAKITIELFDDRVEVSNPGGLTNAIKPKEFGTKSHSRNPLIFGLFVRMRLVEQVGSGIGRIKEALKEAKLPEPEFKTEGMFSVVLPKRKSSGKSSGKSSLQNWVTTKQRIIKQSPIKVNKTMLKILEMVFTSAEVTIPEMAQKTGLTERAIEKNIQKLKEVGLLERKEGNKGGYVLIEKNTVEETVEETVEIILRAIKRKPGITARELQTITGLSRRGVEYHLDKMKKNRLIERVGPTKGGIWKIVEKDIER